MVALAGVAVLFGALTFGVGLRALETMMNQGSYSFEGEVDEAAVNEYISSMQVGYLFLQQLPWFATATLLAGISALALAARRAQLAGSASATASRDASSAASVSAGSAESIS